MAHLNQEQVKALNITEGQQITVLTTGGFGAISKTELKIKEVRDGHFVFVHKGKRKKYLLRPTNDMLIFKGWKIDIQTESDTKTFLCDFRLNFMGDPETVKTFIEANNFNHHFEAFDKITAVTRLTSGKEDRVEVYPV